MKSMFKSTLLLGLTTAMAVSSAMGAFTFTNGDLILGFQATGGTGQTTNVFFNLGSGPDLRDGDTTGTLGNISTSLSSAFGADWYDRTDLYFGIIGNLNPNAAAVVDGDAARTFYWSRAAATPGSAPLLPASTYSQASLSGLGSNYGGLETNLIGAAGNANFVKNADDSITLQSTAPEWTNSWSVRNPTPGAGFGIITGGIQQSGSDLDTVRYLDLHRIVNTNSGTGTIPGVIGGSQYITTIAIGDDGSISVIPEPSAALLGSLGALALFRRRRA